MTEIFAFNQLEGKRWEENLEEGRKMENSLRIMAAKIIINAIKKVSLWGIMGFESRKLVEFCIPKITTRTPS
jgi:hypothetical protein